MRRREGERENLGVGTLCVDFLASVASYPNPDDKINTTSFKVQAGGNAGIDTSFVVVGFNWKAIYKFEYPFVNSFCFLVFIILRNFHGLVIYVQFLCFDFQNPKTCCLNFWFDLLAWTGAASVPSALASMLLRLPRIKFAIVTLGEDGCIMLERSVGGKYSTRRKDASVTIPTCISSGQFLGTAEKVPPQELLDTAGAGDSFTGAILYGSYEAVVEQLRNLYKNAVDPPVFH
ncbi:unnamed protein product [Malus baccata var. baccata]